MSQGRYWILTIPHADYVPYLPPGCQYIRGQLERGAESDYLHWQVLVSTTGRVRRRFLCDTFGSTCHAELTRSSAATDYVWKEDTRVAGTQFELGTPAFKRSSPQDWNVIRTAVQCGRLDDVPSDIYVRYYGNLKRIMQDHITAIGMEREVSCYWGTTGTGKSRRAWDEAGSDAYPKDPRTKFWDGYRSHEHVVIDEFRGDIDISHMLRWLDRYPVIIEIKGSSTCLSAKKLWITSNIHPRNWYPTLDPGTLDALLRRMTIVHFDALV